MIDWRQLYEDEQRNNERLRQRARESEQNSEYYKKRYLQESDSQRRTNDMLCAEWQASRDRDGVMRELQSRLDDLAHRYAVLESERNLLAVTVVNAALGMVTK